MSAAETNCLLSKQIYCTLRAFVVSFFPLKMHHFAGSATKGVRTGMTGGNERAYKEKVGVGLWNISDPNIWFVSQPEVCVCVCGGSHSGF